MTKKQDRPARSLAARLAKVLSDYLGGRLSNQQVSVYLRQIADWIDEPLKEQQEANKAKEGKDEKEEPLTPQARWLFEYWVRATHRDRSRTQMTPARKTKLLARLKEGYSVEDIKRAIDGVANSSFHQGENERETKYDDLLLICRSGDSVEKYRDMTPRSVSDEGKHQHDELTLLREQAREALKEGDTDAYNRANKRLAQLTGR